MWTRITRAVDRRLWRQGFQEPKIRGVLRRGILFTGASLALGALLAPLTPLPFWFGVGSLLAVWNFHALAGFIGRILPGGWSSGALIKLLLHSNLRLFLTGLCLYICIVWCNVPPAVLLAGLTVTVFDVTLTSLRRSTPRPPEASAKAPPATEKKG